MLENAALVEVQRFFFSSVRTGGREAARPSQPRTRRSERDGRIAQSLAANLGNFQDIWW